MHPGQPDIPTRSEKTEYNAPRPDHMDRITLIMNDPRFLEAIKQTEDFEKARVFCRHDWQHLLDVARIMQIFCLRENLPVPDDLIYAAALLHDIGRARQYEDGTPHDIAGMQIAGLILSDCGFNNSERNLILYAIGRHRSHAALSAGGKHSQGSDDSESDDLESDDLESNDLESTDLESTDLESTDMESDVLGSDVLESTDSGSTDSRENKNTETLKIRFAQIMYAADKKSRPCYACNARQDCNWPEERKNRTPMV
ncbi:MAG: HD domain-containing protein [Bilifractor sp.]